MAELSDYQKDILIRTALGEARGEGVEGMADVIQVILNRANSGEFPSDPAAAALQPNEFSTWNKGAGGNNPGQFSTNSETYKKGQRALELVLSGTRPDYTGGALFYKTPAVKSPFHDSQNKYGTIERNGHLFYPTRPVPPGEIPNVVASLQDTTPPPRVAPNPATISPDLSLMRNPTMSSAARNAQVTPSGNVPLPRNRPSAPDIVTPTMASLARPAGNVNATRAVDMLAATANPVTPRLTDAGDNIYSYHIPDMTPTTVTGGLGSLTPSPARVRLPDLPPSNIGKPPTTRVVQSASYNLQPTAREIAQAPGTTIATIPTTARPNTAQINDAARRAALTANQSNVERALPPIPSIPSVGSSAANINAQRAEQMGQRVATAIPARLSPGVAAQAYDASINGPAGLTVSQFAALPDQGVLPSIPSLAAASVPLPRRRPDLVAAPIRLAAPTVAPRRVVSAPTTRVVVNGAGSYSAPPALSPLQALRAQGLTSAQAYSALTAPRTTLEDRVRGSTGLSASGASAYSLV